MREILARVVAALTVGEPVGLAVVVRTWSSAPCPAGTAMAVTADGVVVGSVSGGCVEGAVYEQCREVLDGGDPQRTSYGVSDDDAFAVGLACGGTIEVAVVRLGPTDLPVVAAASDAVAAHRPVTLALRLPRTPLSGPRRAATGLLAVLTDGSAGSLGDAELDRRVQAEAPRGPDADDAVVLTLPLRTAVPPPAGVLGTAVPPPATAVPPSADVLLVPLPPPATAVPPSADVLLVPLPPPARLVVVGATEHAVGLCRAGRLLGYRISVVDARAVFATPQRLPGADEVVVAWPARWLATQDLQHRDAVCVLTHDAKVDVPALVAALGSGAGYVGALGSRRTHADRVVRLHEAGVLDHEIARIRSPIGLDIGARTPAETAVSILAEVVRARRGGTGSPLVDGDGPVHAPAP